MEIWISFVEDMNVFFKSVSAPLDPISEDNPFLQQQCEVPIEYTIIVETTKKRLSNVTSFTAGDPDGLPIWIFRDFFHILADFIV